jgi:hypothetical protein
LRPVRDRLGGRVPEPPNGPGQCRRCGADVIYARTLPAGRVMRVDPRPCDVGAYVLTHDRDGFYLVSHHTQFTEGAVPARLWAHHVVTCTNPRPRPSRRPAPVQLQLGRVR